mgnify:CR=1
MRKCAAKYFRNLLDKGVIKKRAIELVCVDYSISRRSLYSYCKRFKVNIK